MANAQGRAGGPRLPCRSRSDPIRPGFAPKWAARARSENTIASWQLIVDHVRRHDARGVLLVDRMTGPALSASNGARWWTRWKVRACSACASPCQAQRLQEVEYCEIYALEAASSTGVRGRAAGRPVAAPPGALIRRQGCFGATACARLR
jgi:hypothetical protein